ncbi:hypothetical protein SFB1_117G1, partial [Candidatus Arthromitus sp. SFB-1]
VVFIPPAVDPGDPPISIRIHVKNTVPDLIPLRSIELNPAVLGDTDEKILFNTLLPKLMFWKVNGLSYSNIKYKAAPINTKKNVVTNTTLVVTDIFLYTCKL